MTFRLVSLILGLWPVLAPAQQTTVPPREQFHLFLLVGQSNMAGRGLIDDPGRTPHPRVLMLSKEKQWVPAMDPMHFDKPIAGVGLGRTFAEILAQADPGVTIGLVPCAVGGSPIDAWQPGAFYAATKSHPWDDMALRVAEAGAAGTWKGILWHQGEADSLPGLAEVYEAKLLDLVSRFRQLLGAPELPFLLGQMGKFPDAPWSPEAILVDQAHRDLPAQVPHTAFVSAEGLKHKGDKVHFDTASYREFGRRYAQAFQAMH